MYEQASLFTDQEQRQLRHSGLRPTPTLPISLATLRSWKQRVQAFQSTRPRQLSGAQETLLLEGLAQSAPSLENLDPFTLPPQNIEFWRWPAGEPGEAALYFVIDGLLLLYVGETCKANQRWKGVHDCKRYVKNYITLHRQHQCPVSVHIGFWPHAPIQTRARQQMESQLIHHWRSPFNKENWRHWGTPFIKG